MYLKNIFKKTRKPRESGHYWVKWSGLAHNSPGVWRMGAYEQYIGWRLPGEERIYQDGAFIEINEARIPFSKGKLYSEKWYWVAVILNIAGFIYYTIYLLTYR